MADVSAPVINEDADRVLGRIIVRHGMAMLGLLLPVSFVMAFVNIPQSPLFGERRFLDTVSVLVVLAPFFAGINKLFAARLRIGRALVGEHRWREAIAALDPFAGPSQRFLDGSGEAHYLLALAYAGAGDMARADAARGFVRRHRPGHWADLLDKPVQEKRSRAAKRVARRRF